MKNSRTKASSVGWQMMLEAAVAALLAPLALFAWLHSSSALPQHWFAGLCATALAAALVAALVAGRHARVLRRQLMAWNRFVHELLRDKSPTRAGEAPHSEFGRTTRRLQRLAQRLARRRSLDEVLARVDEAQLIKPDRRTLVGGILKCLELVAGGEIRALAMFETQAESTLTVHLYAASRRRLETLRLELDGELARRLRTMRAPESGAVAPFPEDLAARLQWEAGVRHYIVLPVQRAGRPWAFLVAGHREPSAITRADARLLDEARQRLIAGFRGAEREELLHSLAFVDRLTGLPNRDAFDATLRQRLAARAPNDPAAAILLIDIDRLKQVNDSFGRAVGDRLLVEARLRLALRLNENDVLARLGGGEFAVFLSHAIDARSVGTVARRMLQSMARAMLIDGNRIYSGASIGIARIPVDGTEPAELIKRAGAAMLRAKAQGRNRLMFYARGMLSDSRRRSRLEGDLRRALKRGELVLLFEARVRVDGGQLCGTLARIAWQHPERGLLPLEAFIEDAEAIGLAPQLGMWLLEQACHQLRRWRDADVAPGQMSCCLPDAQLERSWFAAELRRLAQQAELASGSLLLEIDGTALARQRGHVAASLAAISEVGAALAVADFGRAAVPFAPLIQQAVSHVRLDIGALERQASPETMAAIVQGLTNTAHALGKRVLAEGVERPLQLRMLRSLGCDEVQGVLLGSAQPRAQFELQHFGRVLEAPAVIAPEPPPALTPGAALQPLELDDLPTSGDRPDAELLEAQLTVPMALSEEFPLTLGA